MKIVLLSEFFLSGQTTHVLDLTRQLHKLGHEVHLIFTRINTLKFNYYRELLEKEEIPFTITANKGTIQQIIKKTNPHVLHVHSSTIFNLTRYMAASFSIPYVITCHGLGLHKERYYTAFADAAQIIAVGPKTVNKLLPLFNEKINIIINGVDIEIFHPISKMKQLKIVYLGRLDRSKLNCLLYLHEAVTDFPELELEVMSNWHPPISDLKFKPWTSNPAEILNQSNIMAGCGRAAREAMASGNVVLLMSKYYDGLVTPRLVKKADFDFSGTIRRYSTVKLRYDLNLLINHRRLLKRLQRFSRKYAVENLDARDMTLKTLHVYEKSITEYIPPKKSPNADLILKGKYWTLNKNEFI